MRVNGRCHCGYIQYEAEVDPETVSICHCTDCQMFSGSAFRVSVQAKSGDFHLRSGTPTVYVKTAESGAKRAQAFCSNCGSPVYSAAPENTAVYVLRVGGLDRRAELTPRKRIWCNSTLPWSTEISEVAQHPRG